MDAHPDDNKPGLGLLEAISHALRVLDEDSGGEEQALRESFRMACRGLTAERASWLASRTSATSVTCSKSKG